MNRLTIFLAGVVVGAAGLYTCENFYVVRSSESFHLIPKIAGKLEIPYRDIRNYQMEDWQRETSLALSIYRSQKQELITESGVSAMQAQLQNLLDSFGK